MIHPTFSEVNPLVVYRLKYREYREIKAANASGLKRILQSPAHYLYDRNNPEDSDSKSKEFGRLVHMAFLETDEFRELVRIYPDFGTGKGSRTSKWEWEEQQYLDNPECCLMKQEDADRLSAIVKALRAHPKANEILTDGASEVTLTWNDKQHGLACKARVDYLVKGERPIFADLKTTTDASYSAFRRASYSFGYDISAAHYTRGGMDVFGVDPIFVFIAVESDPPHEVQVFVASESMIEIGEARRQRALTRLKQCIETQEFPGYGKEPVNLYLPHYALYEEEELS